MEIGIGIQWPLVLFTVISGAGFGLLATCGFACLVGKPSRNAKRIVLVIVFALLCVGGLMSVFHLSHPERFMGAITNLLSFSGIALELLGLMAGCAAAVLFFLFVSADNGAGEKVCAVCAIAVGAVAAFLQGHAYTEVTAQVGWNTITLAFSYLLTSLSAGSILYVVLLVWLDGAKDASLTLVGKVACGLAVLACVAVASYVVVLGISGLLSALAAALAIAALVFEIMTVVGALKGGVQKLSVKIAGAAAATGVLGSLTVRVLMWIVGAYQFSLIADAVANRGLYIF